LPNIPLIVKRWLPDGRREGNEWVTRNPTRADKNPGSFKINLRTGRWADFATGHIGGDAISLAAYLFGLSQVEAARKLALMLNVCADGE
jgi:DNA primase